MEVRAIGSERLEAEPRVSRRDPFRRQVVCLCTRHPSAHRIGGEEVEVRLQFVSPDRFNGGSTGLPEAGKRHQQAGYETHSGMVSHRSAFATSQTS